VKGAGALCLFALGAWACGRPEAPDAARGVTPSFDCASAEGGVEQLICATPELAALDRTLDSVWSGGMDRMAAGGAPTADLDLVRAEQRGWIGGRNDCWKAEDVPGCTEEAYRERIAVVQAQFELAPGGEASFWTCEGNPANEFVVTFFDTDPRTARVERGDRQEVFVATRSASGARYLGSFGKEAWFKGEEAMFVWPQTDTLSCQAR
jgi:uncharacterized protein